MSIILDCVPPIGILLPPIGILQHAFPSPSRGPEASAGDFFP